MNLTPSYLLICSKRVNRGSPIPCMMNLAKVAVLASLLMIPLITTQGSSTVIFRGHVGAVGKGYAIVWVEEVLEGPLTEGGVIEVLKGKDSCSGIPHIDAVEVGDFVEVKGYLETKCCRQTVILECGDHYLKKLRNVMEAGIRILQGCGNEIDVGSNITFLFFVSRDSNVTVVLERGTNTIVLFEGSLKAGLYSISRLDDGPEGERRVCILAESMGESTVGCCDFTAVSRERRPQPEYRNLTVKVVTEAGYPVRNASVYVDGVFYGFTDRNGILETNISEGVHEVRVESEYYRTAIAKSGPSLVVVKVRVKAPEVSLSFSPEEINGSGKVKLVVKRLGGADISIRVKLTPFGDLRVNATEVVGVPPFNVTLEVRGEGKLVASYGKITAVLNSEIPEKKVGETQTSKTPATQSPTRTKVASPTTSTSAITSTSAPTTSESTATEGKEVPEVTGLYWIVLLLAALLVATLVVRKWWRARTGTSPPSNGGSARD